MAGGRWQGEGGEDVPTAPPEQKDSKKFVWDLSVLSGGGAVVRMVIHDQPVTHVIYIYIYSTVTAWLHSICHRLYVRGVGRPEVIDTMCQLPLKVIYLNGEAAPRRPAWDRVHGEDRGIKDQSWLKPRHTGQV